MILPISLWMVRRKKNDFQVLVYLFLVFDCGLFDSLSYMAELICENLGGSSSRGGL